MPKQMSYGVTSESERKMVQIIEKYCKLLLPQTTANGKHKNEPVLQYCGTVPCTANIKHLCKSHCTGTEKVDSGNKQGIKTPPLLIPQSLKRDADVLCS